MKYENADSIFPEKGGITILILLEVTKNSLLLFVRSNNFSVFIGAVNSISYS